jgi:putative membrane protein
MLGTLLTLIVAAIHFYFVYLEMVMWEAPRTRKVFGTTEEFASATKVLAANQGLYNGFLAAGLIVGLLAGLQIMVVYLLVCVAVAGVYGAVTATRAAFVAQTIPALLALFLVWRDL